MRSLVSGWRGNDDEPATPHRDRRRRRAWRCGRRCGGRPRGRKGESRGSVRRMSRRRRQQPDGRFSEARRPVPRLSGEGAARLQVGPAQERDHGGLRAGAVEAGCRERRRLLRVPAGGGDDRALTRGPTLRRRNANGRARSRRPRRVPARADRAYAVLSRNSQRSRITHAWQFGERATHT